ncbi:MAG TPA: imidazolonepropionase [Bacteroidales bacterium]|nr:imidazolonepropionase [Bacteroidales bacterium]
MNTRKLIGPFAQLLTMAGMPLKGPLADNRLEVIENAGIVVEKDNIVQIGFFDDLKLTEKTIEPVSGHLTVLPGFIDVHTHICWGGSRAGDYAMRLSGRTYLEIAAEGGGIRSTVANTRAAGESELTGITADHANALLKQGITTIEVKSGYGLTAESELKMLRAIQAASSKGGSDLISTCLAAHIKPPDFTGSAIEYLEFVIAHLLPVVKEQNLAQRVDIYIDKGAFSVNEGRYYLAEAKKMGFDIVIHADQFYTGGLELAFELNAVSADHLEATPEKDIERLAASDVIPVALPAASLGLGASFTPARKILNAGATLVIASDWNPGSAPMGRLVTAAAILGVYEKLTMAETLAALTFRAAPALRLSDRGMLKPGMLADFIAFPGSDWREIIYNQGAMEPRYVWKRGIRQNDKP